MSNQVALHITITTLQIVRFLHQIILLLLCTCCQITAGCYWKKRSIRVCYLGTKSQKVTVLRPCNTNLVVQPPMENTHKQKS